MTDPQDRSAGDDRSERPQDPPPEPAAQPEPFAAPSQQPDDQRPGEHQQQPYGQPPPYPATPPQYYGMPRYAPKPGVIPLRPLGLGEILDGAITAMRTYPKQMLGMSAIVAVATNLVAFGIMVFLINATTLFVIVPAPGMTEVDIQLEQLRIALLASIPAVVIGMVAGMVLNGILTIVMGKAVLGQPVTAAEAWRLVKPRFGALLAVSVLYGLLVFGLFVGAGIIGVVLLDILGILLAAVPAVWLYVMFSLSSTALILEGATVGRAFTRSRALVRNAWWRTFGILLLTAVIAAILQFVIDVPFSLVDGGLDAVAGTGPQPSVELSLLLTALSGIISQTITLPFASGVTTLIYIDRRMRREGMDIELARQTGQDTPPPPGPAPGAW